MKTAKVELKGLKLRYGMKGVLAKDNKTPWAPNTLHSSSTTGWKYPMHYSIESVLLALMDSEVKELEVIDHNNDRFVLEIKR
jgi:hypothetical protein